MAFIGTSIVAAEKTVTKQIYNVTIATANTEQSQVLPTSIVGYLVRTRGNTELKLSHTATESGTKYVTIPKKSTYVDEHSYNNLTLYFQSPESGDVVEIIAWEI